MTNPTKIDRARDRAARLRREARNCLAIAVGEKVEQHAAALIDEAIRLTRRSRELSEAGVTAWQARREHAPKRRAEPPHPHGCQRRQSG